MPSARRRRCSRPASTFAPFVRRRCPKARRGCASRFTPITSRRPSRRSQSSCGGKPIGLPVHPRQANRLAATGGQRVSLKETMTETTFKVIIQPASAPAPALERELSGTVEFGRQNHLEPPPFCHQTDSGVHRII